ncbi:hypothetical protein [Azohydromonas australica]|uniref:hypothetical protein n=1 Tax=Azohydromonas australica TaxID=364039 RepID=UPI00040F8158|nr:hypothetical protein [Azohydromonas australica]
MPGFLIGIVVGALAASAYLKKKGGTSLASASSSPSRSAEATGGRVDELSSAAQMTSPETASLNAGDGTPSGSSATSSAATSGMSRPTSPQTPATGLSESRH